MHELNPRIVAMIDAEVVRDPDATTQELFDLGVLLDEAVSDLRLDEFAEIYEQPARGGRRDARKSRKRARKRRSPPAPSTPTPAPTPAPTVDRRVLRRHAVRRELERFAVDLSSAEGDTERFVAVIADLDRYVARVMKAVES